MAIQSPIVLASGFFSQLFPGDTVPGTDTTAQASGNAALVLAGTALASGNAGISTGLTALASGNAGLVSASNKVPISGGYMTGQLFAASGVVVSGTLSRNGFNVVTVGDVETVTSTMIASGTIIDADVNISGAINATKLNFLQAGASGVARTVDSKLKDTVSVKDFGAVGDGVSDDTVAIQAAITASVAAGVTLFMPAGTYLVTDILNCPAKTMIIGEHKSMSAIQNGTRINFVPTSTKNLFSTGVTGAFKDAYCFENLWVTGNSTNASGFSNRAFDLIKVIKSRFSNMRIMGFREAFRVEASINNRFEFIQTSDTYIAGINYTGDYATTDVWEQCYISNSPIGVQTDGYNLGIRFNSCVFESIDTYGVNLAKESYGWMFTDTYSEDVPSINLSTNAMFRVGYSGTTPEIAVQLIINGGLFGGRNAGAVGSFLDVDYTYGVILGGFYASRYTNVVNTTVNTLTAQVVAKGWGSQSVSTQVSDTTKVVGFYPLGVANSGTRHSQNASWYGVGVGNTPPATSGIGLTFPASPSLSTNANCLDEYTEFTSSSIACTGAITPVVQYKATKVGNCVTLTLPATSGTATASAFFRYGEDLPVNFRPTVIAVTVLCAIRNNGTNELNPGMIIIGTDGSIKVFRDVSGSNFTAAGTAGLAQGTGWAGSWSV